VVYKPLKTNISILYFLKLNDVYGTKRISRDYIFKSDDNSFYYIQHDTVRILAASLNLSERSLKHLLSATAKSGLLSRFSNYLIEKVSTFLVGALDAENLQIRSKPSL
jgi:hypothetical protein